MESVFVLVLLAVLAVPVLAIVALVMVSSLKGRVAELESQVAKLAAASAARQEPARQPAPAPQARPAQAPEVDAARPAPPPPAAHPPADRPVPHTSPSPSPSPSPAAPVAARSASAAPSAFAKPGPVRPSPLEVAAGTVRRWFTEGNVPVKVGMLVLFAGVAALLKHASDQGWMTFPIELRLAGVALAAIAGLVLGWRQRIPRRNFALALQGGAVGVLLLVVFAAAKMYGLMPIGAAFGLSVVLVAGLGVLAVRQDAIALAVLGILAGFLAPIWLSTGSGNHVALFGYYALLNLGIFAVAWWRPWRVLNLMGFGFTFGIGAAWGAARYDSADFATTQPFLALFFVLYLLIPILYAWRRGGAKRGVVDGSLVFGTPLVAFSLQAGLLEGDRMPLAFCALGLGALYAALAWWLRGRERFGLLATSHAVLAVGFATLAVPLALSAKATASVFALEGAALVWLGLRQERRLPQLAGAVLQVMAAVAFFIGLDEPSALAARPVANAWAMGAALISLAGFATAWSYQRNGSTRLALGFYAWALAWWLGNAGAEIESFVPLASGAHAWLAFLGLTAAIAAHAHRRWPAPALAWTVAATLALALPLAWMQAVDAGHPFAGYGVFAWGAYALAGWYGLASLRRDPSNVLTLAHGAWLWAWTAAAAFGLSYLTTQAGLAHGWRIAAFALPVLAMMALVQWHPARVGAPVAARFGDWRQLLQGSVVVVLAGGWLLALFAEGGSAPLPWIPVLNPLELVQLAAVVLLGLWAASTLAPDALRTHRPVWLAGAGFLLASAVTLRATHQWGQVPWDAMMFRESVVQTSLTVLWSVLGVIGWIIGSRRGHRALWLAGAVLMAVVLAKLVLIDRQHLGNLFGILSFLAYGVLCTVVGYIAPAPPKAAGADTEPPAATPVGESA
ncbi:DUF2339 domain-containing protein [Novilysobacter spongiicola]|uniref:Uncharacterized membrane protein n=2 Tax=Novilysobacter TaxID=3382699 RepID=A0A1T4RS92_9GAMM|nr:DUF2339 domain-containing protein [Lysobacter spongiicola]SKA18706.1 Uncharacterized membrane protein [Lysobacter spongiicola DSM 21749]